MNKVKLNIKKSVNFKILKCKYDCNQTKNFFLKTIKSNKLLATKFMGGFVFTINIKIASSKLNFAIQPVFHQEQEFYDLLDLQLLHKR